MSMPALLAWAVKALDEVQIPFMLTGSMACYARNRQPLR